MSQAKLEEGLRRELHKRGWLNIATSVEAVTRAYPAVTIITNTIEPIHVGASHYNYTIEISVLGPSATPNDKEATSTQHKTLHDKLGKDIAVIGTVANCFTIVNCAPTPSAVVEENANAWWSSGYKLDVIG